MGPIHHSKYKVGKTMAVFSKRLTGIKPQQIATTFTFLTSLLGSERRRTSGLTRMNKTLLDNVSKPAQFNTNSSINFIVLTDKVENLDNSNPALLVGQNPELI